MNYTIITDTSSNLPSAILKEYNIRIVPLSYHYEGKEHICTDLSEFDAERYYDALRKRTTVTTSLASIQSFLDCFEKELKEGNDILFIGMSSGISGTFHSAENAAEEILERYPERKILLLDTLAASFGEGLIVMDAIQMKQKGCSLEEAYAVLEAEVQKMIQIFTVEDLGYLHRGGRISGATAVIGSVLHINPILKGSTEGQIIAASKVRGRKRALLTLADCYKKQVVNPEKQVVCISHCGAADDAAFLAAAIREAKEPGSILIEKHEPVTGSHVGPGAIALFFKGDKRITD